MGIEQIRSLKTAPKKEKKVYKLNKRSAKQKVVIKELKKLYPTFLEKHPVCAIQSPGCTQVATSVHHLLGRGPKEVLDIDTYLPVCNFCHLFIEINDAWSREKGFKLNRIK